MIRSRRNECDSCRSIKRIFKDKHDSSGLGEQGSDCVLAWRCWIGRALVGVSFLLRTRLTNHVGLKTGCRTTELVREGTKGDPDGVPCFSSDCIPVEIIESALWYCRLWGVF